MKKTESLGRKDKYENDICNRLDSRSQPVFRKSTSTERVLYQSGSEGEPRRDNRILKKLMQIGTKTTETKRRKVRCRLCTKEKNVNKIGRLRWRTAERTA